jgi:hypothetical protein
MQALREEDSYRNRHTWLISKNIEDEEEEVECINTCTINSLSLI